MDSKDERLTRMRHSASHIMAEAVLSLFPEAKFAIGPAIENGFYYDFDLPRSLTPEDLAVIEQKMRDIVATDAPFEREETTKDEARKLFAAQPYKLELIDDVEGDKVSIYRQDGFVDLCAGPHVERTGEVKAFKLTNVAGAYWRGDEHRPMLQRIYGALFETQAELDEYLRRLEDAAATRPSTAGAGAGAVQLSRGVRAGPGLLASEGRARSQYHRGLLAKEEHYRAGYELILTPHIGKASLWQTSGHLDFYKENMYSPMQVDEQDYYIKPMNCPFHIQIYSSRTRSLSRASHSSGGDGDRLPI